MSILLQGITFSVDFFVLVIEGPNVVLGFPWLQSLGKVAHEYSSLMMEFTWQGVPVTLPSWTFVQVTTKSVCTLVTLTRQLFELMNRTLSSLLFHLASQTPHKLSKPQ
ncbi:unnamed protein product [Vicia faba]|uniref:Uncharacterized protein n=1 Tax=Vicia faba TaxID=3906 RepID=A0AAV0ZFS5_VICFA|nr:unnamed protein product [Vicia faba]